jgi:hypothetical protein
MAHADKPNRCVRIDDAALAYDLGGLLSVIESLLPIRASSTGTPGSPAGRIVSTIPPASGSPQPADVPRLELTPVDARREALAISEIRFTTDAKVPWPFRGRSLAIQASVDAQAHAAMSRMHGVDVLATDAEGRPLWTVDGREASPVHRTSLCPPDAPVGSDVSLAASGHRFIQVLPLFHFLHGLVGDQALSNPPLRASYIIDDPNLHWPNYGYCDYRDIADSARADRFHVAFATIPLDSWCVHASAADIFRNNASGLSLLIHGNNHAKHELAQNYSREDCAALLCQALARTRLLESKAKFGVSRVMVPPHGACSSRMLAELPRQGFESACISAGSLRAHNPGQSWTKSLGFAPSELVEGCPVLPRWAFAGTTDATLLIAAYLGQPLILRGHHQDLKDGLDLLRGFARTINSLGDVQWGSLGELSRLNYRHRVEGRTMIVQPLGTRVRVAVPAGVDELRVQSVGAEWESPDARASSEDGTGQFVMAVEGGRTCSLVMRMASDPAARIGRPPATSPKLILRRVLTETRDRLRFA